jgi:hypothetical protein
MRSAEGASWKEDEWSYWDERHGRWVGLATWEECLAVERCGSSQDTIERQGGAIPQPRDCEGNSERNQE